MCPFEYSSHTHHPDSRSSIPCRYMLDWNSILDFRTMSRIIDSGHSRIPVYRDERTNIEGVLYVKELMFVDPDDEM